MANGDADEMARDLLRRGREEAATVDLNAYAFMWKGSASGGVKVADGKLRHLVEQAWKWSADDFQHVTISVYPGGDGPSFGALEVEIIGRQRLKLPPR